MTQCLSASDLKRIYYLVFYSCVEVFLKVQASLSRNIKYNNQILHSIKPLILYQPGRTFSVKLFASFNDDEKAL